MKRLALFLVLLAFPAFAQPVPSGQAVAPERSTPPTGASTGDQWIRSTDFQKFTYSSAGEWLGETKQLAFGSNATNKAGPLLMTANSQCDTTSANANGWFLGVRTLLVGVKAMSIDAAPVCSLVLHLVEPGSAVTRANTSSFFWNSAWQSFTPAADDTATAAQGWVATIVNFTELPDDPNVVFFVKERVAP